METILYLTHTQNDGTLSKVSLEVLSASIKLSKDLNASLVIGLVGEDVKKAGELVSGAGAAKVLAVTGSDFGKSRYSTDVLALEALIKESKATLILAPATSRLNRVLPGVAIRTGGAIDTRISGLKASSAGLQVERWYYRQRMVATLERKTRPWILLVDSGIEKPFEGSSGTSSIEEISVAAAPEAKRTEVKGEESPSTDAETIRPDAEVLFVAGAGWGKKQSDGKTHIKDAEGIILGFLDKSKSSLGSSKSLVDQGVEGEEVLSFMSHLNQVGQTGSTPRHPKGLATCCHGEEPHTVGWRFINERRAINTDPNCGWAQGKADILYVADAFEVIKKVNELL